MGAKIELTRGLWRHNKEGIQYFVIGNARILKSPTDFIGNPELVGTALSVEGYEDTGLVSGNKVQVYEERGDSGSPVLRFLKTGKFDAPDDIVVYRQLADGKQYKQGQLWWRPPENFATNFTPLNLKK